MNLLAIGARARDLYHMFSQAPEMARETVREFYRRFDETGALPLGYRVRGTTREYCWVVIKPMPLQGQYMAANTPSDANLVVMNLY